MRGNYLTALPSSFTKLKNIKTLLLGTPLDELERNPNFLNGNWLTKLPNSFPDLVSLTRLQLEENQLSFLPDNFGNLCNLEMLKLGE